MERGGERVRDWWRADLWGIQWPAAVTFPNSFHVCPSGCSCRILTCVTISYSNFVNNTLFNLQHPIKMGAPLPCVLFNLLPFSMQTVSLHAEEAELCRRQTRPRSVRQSSRKISECRIICRTFTFVKLYTWNVISCRWIKQNGAPSSYCQMCSVWKRKRNPQWALSATGWFCGEFLS